MKNKNICIFMGSGKDMLRGGGQRQSYLRVHDLFSIQSGNFFFNVLNAPSARHSTRPWSGSKMRTYDFCPRTAFTLVGWR